MSRLAAPGLIARAGPGSSRSKGIIALALSVAVLALLADPAAALPDKTWVLVIGNNIGAGDDVTLHYAERDARQMADVLRTQSGVSGRRTRMLLGEKADAVQAALADLDATIAREAAGEPSALFVYYSGHADADALRMSGTQLAFETLRQSVGSTSAKVRLLVVDACRSGGVTRVKGVRRGDDFELRIDDGLEAEGMAIITSSTAGETSQESDRLKGSFFSHHFVNALRGAGDQNGDGRITLGEAYGYTYSQTVRSTGRTLVVQHPTYAFDVKGRGEVVLVHQAGGNSGLGRLTLGEAGRYLISEWGSGGSVVAEVTPPRSGATLALGPRRYLVQHRGDDAYREYDVRLGAGETRSLARLPHRAYRYDRLVRKRGGEVRPVHAVTVLGGARGQIVDGGGAAPQLVVGYGLDLPWFTVGARLRGSTSSSFGSAFEQSHQVYGAGLTLQRFVDFEWASIAFGLFAEGTLHRQQFATDRDAPAVQAWGGAFGGLFSAERVLYGRYSLRIEGGPITELFPLGETIDDEPEAGELATPLTWWAAAGLVTRF